MRKPISILCLSIVIVSSVLIQVPLYNRAIVPNDEGAILCHSEEIFNGKVFYRDIPSFAAPGIFYLLALLYKVFGVSLLVSRYATAVAFSATAVLVFFLARHLMSEILAFLTALIFVSHRVWAFPIWHFVSYVPFSIFFLSMALFFLFKFNDKPHPLYIFLTGALVGLATWFKHDYGAFIAMGIFLYLAVWASLRPKCAGSPQPTPSLAKRIGFYVAGGLAVSVPALLYFAWKGALDELFHFAVLWPLTLEVQRDTTKLIPLWPLFHQDAYVRAGLSEYAPSVSFTQVLLGYYTGEPTSYLYRETAVWDFLLKLVHYSPYIALLGLAGTLAAAYRKGLYRPASQNKVPLFIFAGSLLLTQHRPFDFAHLVQMYMPFFLVIGCLSDSLLKWIALRKVLYYCVSALLALVAAVYLGFTFMNLSFIVDTYSARLEGPRAGFFLWPYDRDVLAESIRYIQQNTAPEEPIFVYPYHSAFYFLSERPNPTRFYILWPVKFVPDMDQEIIETLESEHVRFLVYSPNLRPPLGTVEEIAPKFARYVRYHYTEARKFGDPERGMSFIIMKRKEPLTADSHTQGLASNRKRANASLDR